MLADYRLCTCVQTSAFPLNENAAGDACGVCPASNIGPRENKMRKLYSLVVFFGLVLNLQSLSAQNNTARLTGTIIDSSGGAILAGEVSVTNVETGIKWVTSSNDSGIYQIPLLQPGTYRVVVRKEG